MSTFLLLEPLVLQSLSQAPHSPHFPQRPATSRYLILKTSECRPHLAGPRTARNANIYTLKGSVEKKVAEQHATSVFLKRRWRKRWRGRKKKVRNMQKPLHISIYTHIICKHKEKCIRGEHTKLLRQGTGIGDRIHGD